MSAPPKPQTTRGSAKTTEDFAYGFDFSVLKARSEGYCRWRGRATSRFIVSSVASDFYSVSRFHLRRLIDDLAGTDTNLPDDEPGWYN